MSDSRRLLMIPGPVELSPAVLAACAVPPPGHLDARLVEAFGSALARMRQVWLAPASSQPFVVPGAGTLAMELAVANLVEPGDRVLLVNTGTFSERMALMLRRAGAAVREVTAPVGDAPEAEAVARALDELHGGGPVKALVATHVDTSTGVRIDPEPLARLAHEHGALSIFDGVCATAAERFAMADWQADVYLTASQKAIGLPPGLALVVAGERALSARAARRAGPPPAYLDWESWRPIMTAYEERRPAYFSTPATGLVLALDVGLDEILAGGMERRFADHERAAGALREAWRVLDLAPVPVRPRLEANTLSALRFPAGIGPALIGRIAERGVTVAGGLHPALHGGYFRVGHMGYVVQRADLLRRTVEAVAGALGDGGAAVDARAAVAALDRLGGA